MESQKDIQKDVKDKRLEKLVTAIFMVTGLMDKDEPLRNQLRSISLKLVSGSEASFGSGSLASLVSQLLSLINISTSIGLVSDMNGNILNKELSKLNESLPTLQSLNFEEVFSKTLDKRHALLGSNSNVVYKPNLSLSRSRTSVQPGSKASFEPGSLASSESKIHRRENILKLIRDKKEVTIKDISSNISDCSEKTIQRELIALLRDKVIQKTGEKRWSKYFI